MTPQIAENPRPTREFAINSLIGCVAEAAKNLPPEIAQLDVSDLEKDRKPTEVDYFLRKNLWKQVELCQKGIITHVQPSSIYAGVCSEPNYSKIALQPYRVAWLFTYPEPIEDRLEAALSIATTNLLKFVAREPTSENANAFLKAYELLMNRVKGPIIQKVHALHAHRNLNKPLAQTPTNPDDVQKKLEEMRAQIIEPETKDVTPK
jgi:hypothetical protein